jgi:hypothetical protein
VSAYPFGVLNACHQVNEPSNHCFLKYSMNDATSGITAHVFKASLLFCEFFNISGVVHAFDILLDKFLNFR